MLLLPERNCGATRVAKGMTGACTELVRKLMNVTWPTHRP